MLLRQNFGQQLQDILKTHILKLANKNKCGVRILYNTLMKAGKITTFRIRMLIIK